MTEFGEDLSLCGAVGPDSDVYTVATCVKPPLAMCFQRQLHLSYGRGSGEGVSMNREMGTTSSHTGCRAWGDWCLQQTESKEL